MSCATCEQRSASVRERTDGPTLVFGWSFGASVALREAFEDERVGALALFGLPLRPNDLAAPAAPDARRSSGS